MRRCDSGAAVDSSKRAGQAEGRTRRACGAEPGLLQLLVVRGPPLAYAPVTRVPYEFLCTSQGDVKLLAGAATDRVSMCPPQVPGGAADMYIRAS